MQGLISKEKAFEQVEKAIKETLEVDVGAIKPESLLTKDLGAESLDFLDINYRVEQAFGIRMARYFVMEHAEELFGEGTVLDEQGRITAKGVLLLKARFGSQASQVRPGMEVDVLPNVITVQNLADAVMDILNTLPDHCPACSKSAWTCAEEIRIRCDACGAKGAFISGDDLTQQWLRELQERERIF